jgi:hypothetical protein
MLSKIAAENLAKDRKVLGKQWFQTYGGWFSDRENIQTFINSVIGSRLLPHHNLEILYLGSASGVVGEELLQTLQRGHLTIVDVSQEHLDLNTNPSTTKLCLDVLGMNLHKKFDVVMMRSFLDYFPSRADQIAVLRTVRNHLVSGGTFINQPAFISDIKARDLISQAYCSVPSIGKRLFQSHDIGDLYAEAGFNPPIKYGESKHMMITDQDHIVRYGISGSDVKMIQSIVKNAEPFAEVTERGYNLEFEFPIFINTHR